MTGKSDRPGRWLVLADEEPVGVRLESYAERVAGLLRELGERVILFRSARGELPGKGQPELRDVTPAPIPLPLTRSNRLLARAIRFQRVIGQAAASEGPFEAILCEGAIGALVGPTVAVRHAIPFVLALPQCEVARRKNQLDREQLHLSELEQWGAERAQAVIVPSVQVAEAVERHYGVQSTVLPTPPVRAQELKGGDLLLRRLGISSPYVLVLGEEAEPASRLPDDRAVVHAGQDLWIRLPDAPPFRLAQGRVCGPALGRLIAAAEDVVVTDGGPAGEADAAGFSKHAAGADAGAALAIARRVVARLHELEPASAGVET